MYKTATLLVSTHVEKLFNFLLLFYPEQYRKKYGQEMRLLFQDMYQEELSKKGSIGIGFWFSQVGDITQSVIEQHIDMIQKQGMKKYLQQTFHINKYNVIGGILLLPFVIIFSADFIARVVQGDLTHYNRPFYAFLSHNYILTGQAQIFWVILFPLIAVVLNIIPFVSSLMHHKKKFTLGSLFFANPLAIIIAGLGFLSLIIAFGHDVIPCFFNGIFLHSVFNIGKLISICRNA